MTTAARSLPKPIQVAKMLSDLLGKKVETESSNPLGDISKGSFVVVTYAPYGGEVAAALISDLLSAASLAAALTMVPASRVDEIVRARKLDDVLKDNFREVANVMVSLLNHDSLPAMSLREVHAIPPALPADLAGRIAKPSERVDIEIGVDGYDGGHMTFLLL